jgi:DNA primase
MAKTYLSTIKYEIKANFEITGIVEKPDIIGAIFGQSEGLLGEDMDLKELQQNGKLGRIDIIVKKGKGKTTGEIIIPSSLDKVKTSILAATIETVDKVGPCDAKVTILSISDTRQEKRSVITDRAKELLKRMQSLDTTSENIEIADEIKSDLRIESSEEIIVVEGRADVLKLLSYGIKNVIEMNGSNLSPQLFELCKRKVVTVLIDGDRGGELNVKKLASLTKVDFVAKAPDGKEVEELTQKEILLSLKRKGSLEDAFSRNKPNFNDQPVNRFNQNSNNNFRNNFNRPNYPNQSFNRDSRPSFNQQGNQRFDRDSRNYPAQGFNRDSRPSFNQQGNQRFDRDSRNNRDLRNNNDPRNNFNRPNYPNQSFNRDSRPSFNQQSNQRFDRDSRNSEFKPAFNQEHAEIKPVVQEQLPKEILDLKKDFDKLKGTKKARILDEKFKKVKEAPVLEIFDLIEKSKKKISVLMYDGVISKKVIDAAEKKDISYIVAVKKSKFNSKKVKLLTM